MLSDRIGRKPVLLIGIAGTCLSMLLLGLSKTLLHLILRFVDYTFDFGDLISIGWSTSRCLVGFLNGNTGVMKSLVGGMLDCPYTSRSYRTQFLGQILRIPPISHAFSLSCLSFGVLVPRSGKPFPPE